MLNTVEQNENDNYMLRLRTPKECAKRMGVSIPEVKRLWNTNALPYISVGAGRTKKHYRSTYKDCDDYLRNLNCRGYRPSRRMVG